MQQIIIKQTPRGTLRQIVITANCVQITIKVNRNIAKQLVDVIEGNERQITLEGKVERIYDDV